MDDDLPRGQFDGLPGAGKRIGTLALDLDCRICRRALIDDAGEAGQRGADLLFAGARLALGRDAALRPQTPTAWTLALRPARA
jgi:hypothetical protein